MDWVDDVFIGGYEEEGKKSDKNADYNADDNMKELILIQSI